MMQGQNHIKLAIEVYLVRFLGNIEIFVSIRRYGNVVKRQSYTFIFVRYQVPGTGFIDVTLH